MSEKLRVCFVTPEAVPFVKTGGLADVAGALPRALHDAGCDVAVVLPAYRAIDRQKLAFRPIGAGSVPLGPARADVRFFAGRFPDSTVPVRAGT